MKSSTSVLNVCFFQSHFFLCMLTHLKQDFELIDSGNSLVLASKRFGKFKQPFFCFFLNFFIMLWVTSTYGDLHGFFMVGNFLTELVLAGLFCKTIVK